MKKIEKKIKEIFKKYHGEGCQYCGSGEGEK